MKVYRNKLAFEIVSYAYLHIDYSNPLNPKYLGDCDVFAPYATQSYQIVEYFINQQRYYLCADGFTAENADVVCRDTTNALSIEHRAVSVLNLPPNTQIYPLQHSCLGSEASLCKCPTFLQSCSSGSSVEVKCGTPGSLYIKRLRFDCLSELIEELESRRYIGM